MVIIAVIQHFFTGFDAKLPTRRETTRVSD
jgi:hypothetical protein